MAEKIRKSKANDQSIDLNNLVHSEKSRGNYENSGLQRLDMSENGTILTNLDLSQNESYHNVETSKKK